MEIYVELSKRTLEKIQNRTIDFTLPYGVELLGNSKGRYLYFECDNSVVDNFKDFLDDRGINWQENEKFIAKVDKKEEKIRKQKAIEKRINRMI
jgi:hypothetical protein